MTTLRKLWLLDIAPILSKGECGKAVEESLVLCFWCVLFFMQYGHRIHLTRYLRITSVGVALVAACTANPYVIGAYLPGGDAGSGAPDTGTPSGGPDASGPSAVSFSAPLGSGANSTGTSNLSDTLTLSDGLGGPLDGGSDGSAPLPAVLRLRGETATATSWPSDE